MEQRIKRKLAWIETVRDLYRTKYAALDTPEDLVRQLIADAVYLATYEGMDLETITKETIEDVRWGFPDT